MTAYDLPTSLTIGGVEHPIRYGWRAVLDIIDGLNQPDFDEQMKMEAMVQILYPKWREIPYKDLQEAIEKACDFIDCGEKPDGKKKPKTVDWKQDAQLIISAVNHVANREVRLDPNIHWWTFYSWYMSIEGGLFSVVLSIRKKRAERKKLEKWEEKFYRENKHIIEFATPESEEIKAEKESILKWLNAN